MTTDAITTALREAADLLDQHPDLPAPYIVSRGDDTVDLNWFLTIDTDDLAEQKRLAVLIVKAIGGTWDKDAGDWGGGTFRFVQRRGLLGLDVQTKREAVCERLVVDTETRTVPAVEAQPERVETVEVVEWRCHPVLPEDARATEAVAS